jgi:hypothetical protein
MRAEFVAGSMGKSIVTTQPILMKWSRSRCLERPEAGSFSPWFETPPDGGSSP